MSNGVAAGAVVFPLSADRLYRPCVLSGASFATTAELEPIDGMLGRSRAMDALAFGARVGKPGFNLVAIGGTGVGMREAVKAMLAEDAAKRPRPPDWVYVNNFAKPDRPIAIELPPGAPPASGTRCASSSKT